VEFGALNLKGKKFELGGDLIRSENSQNTFKVFLNMTNLVGLN
jgi:hypothetical protein